MRNRNFRVQLWLNLQEVEIFNRHIARSGLTREAYLRHLINGLIPTDMPPPDYFTMMRELRAIGTSLNQMAKKAHILNVMDVKRYDTAVAALNKAIVDITNAVMLPRKMDAANRPRAEPQAEPNTERKNE